MTDFFIKTSRNDFGSHAGLAFARKNLKYIKINTLVDSVFPMRSGVANSKILKLYLCVGKPDFEAIRISGTTHTSSAHWA